MNNEQNPDSNKLDNKYVFPNLVKRTGVWPMNVGLFFLYNNIITLLVIAFTLAMLSVNNVTDADVLTRKVEGVSFISTILTLGLTIIYRRTFYIHKENGAKGTNSDTDTNTSLDSLDSTDNSKSTS